MIAVCRPGGFSPRIVNEPNFMATVLALVESALGISLVPCCVRSLNRPVAIRAIAPKSARIPLRATWRNRPKSQSCLGFWQELRPAIRKRMKKLIRQSNEAA